VPVCPSSIIWYQPMGGDARRLGGTAGLAESNGNLASGSWLRAPAGRAG